MLAFQVRWRAVAMAECHLLLGGCGFIGRHVAIGLARGGHDVRVADLQRPTWRFPADAADRIRWQRFDLASPDWDALLACASIVHHYAWTSLPATSNDDPLGDLNSNVAST